MPGLLDFAGRRLSIYDIEDVLVDRWEQTGDTGETVAALSPKTYRTVNALLAPYYPLLAPRTKQLLLRWGSISFYETPSIPEGTILFIDQRHFPNWKKAIEQSWAIINSGTDRRADASRPEDV